MIISKVGVTFSMSAVNFANGGREGFIRLADKPKRFILGIDFCSHMPNEEKDHTYSRSDLNELRNAINYILEEM